MKGVNELTLNHDTMKSAIQYWLNNTILKDQINVTVTNIDHVKEHGSALFKIKFENSAETVNAADDQTVSLTHPRTSATRASARQKET
jgi:hypothetical protein